MSINTVLEMREFTSILPTQQDVRCCFVLVENGAFYMTTKACLDKHKCRLGDQIVLLEMEEHTFTELDSLVDWQIVTNMTEDYGYWPPTNWDEAEAQATQGLSPAKAGIAAAAVLGLGLMLGRMSK